MLSWLGRLALVAGLLGPAACSAKTDIGQSPASGDCLLDTLGCAGNLNASGPDPNGYCGDQTPGLLAAAGNPTNPAAPYSEEAVAGSACNAVQRTYPLADSTHVPDCSPVEFDTNPPTSGHHYPDFPRYGVYDYAIPRGFWVHAMEHGGVVFTYSCTDCDDEVAAAKALIAATGTDPACGSAYPPCSNNPTNTNQMVLTADSGIPTRWAASAWGVALTADCFETAVFQNFAMSFRNYEASEKICGNNCSLDVTQPRL
jgi:hypothetical protein